MHSHWDFGRGGHRGHGHRGHGGPFGGGHGFFGRFGGFMGGGRGFRAARMLASGDLQLIVLVLLEERPRHGYDIIKELEERSSGIYAPSPGVVYPALTYLEEMEYAAAEAEGNKKLYAITDAGKAYLSKNRAGADETLEQLARFGRKMARFQREYADEEDVRDDFGTDPGGEARREWRHFRTQFREIWGDMRDALREKLEAPMEEKERIYRILKNALEEIRKKP